MVIDLKGASGWFLVLGDERLLAELPWRGRHAPSFRERGRAGSGRRPRLRRRASVGGRRRPAARRHRRRLPPRAHRPLVLAGVGGETAPDEAGALACEVTPGCYDTTAIQLDWGKEPDRAAADAGRAASKLGHVLEGLGCFAGASALMIALVGVPLLVISLFLPGYLGSLPVLLIASSLILGVLAFSAPRIGAARRASAAAAEARATFPSLAVSLRPAEDDGSRRGYPLGDAFR
jgi:hypothetical protein